MATMNLQDAVKKFAGDLAVKIENFVSDISELEVRTYTTPHDQINVVTGSKKDIRQMATEGKVTLRAYTQISFDGDTTICVPVDAGGEIDRSVWDMHQSIVNQALGNRAEMLRSIGDAASSALGAVKKSNE